jgi:protein SCO1/2
VHGAVGLAARARRAAAARFLSTRLRVAVIALAALAGAVLGWALWSGPWRGAREMPLAVQVGGPFSLLDQDGRRVSDRDFRGKVMIVEFGFTFCPDVCPLGLSRIAEAMAALGADAKSVQPIFVTVDPARDSPAVLKDYVRHFSDDAVALTGAPEEIAAIARAYRVYYKVNGDPAKDPNYTVDHSALIYVMDREGRFVGTFTHETPVENAVRLVRRAL